MKKYPKSKTFGTLTVLIVGIGFWPCSLLAAPFETLMQKLPAGANVLVVVNVEQILKSEFARVHDSQKKLTEAFAERSILIPPHATQFVLAAQYDLDRRTQIWQAAVMELKTPLDLKQVAQKNETVVEKLGGTSALGTSKAFLLDLGDKQVGLLVPCNRQNAARWAQQLKRSEKPLSSYLAQIGSFGDTAGTDIIVAIDLTDVLPQQFLAERLRNSEVLKGRKVDIDRLASLLAGVRGVRLGIKIGDTCYGKLVVDFQDDATPLADFAKPLIFSALQGAGVMLEDMRVWTLSVNKNTVSLEGQLSANDLQLLMGLVELPGESTAMVDSDAKASPAPKAQSDDSLQREASQKYFRSVEHQLDSLRMDKNNANTNGQIAVYVDNAARRIDRTSTLNVDSELAEYGGTVAKQLRQIASELKGIGIRSGARQAGIYGDDSYYYGDSGDNSYTQSARRQVRAEEKAAGATSSLEIVQQISDQSGAMRRKMTERYKVEF